MWFNSSEFFSTFLSKSKSVSTRHQLNLSMKKENFCINIIFSKIFIKFKILSLNALSWKHFEGKLHWSNRKVTKWRLSWLPIRINLNITDFFGKRISTSMVLNFVHSSLFSIIEHSKAVEVWIDFYPSLLSNTEFSKTIPLTMTFHFHLFLYFQHFVVLCHQHLNVGYYKFFFKPIFRDDSYLI